MSQATAWMEALVDVVSGCMEAYSVMGPLGFRWSEDEQFWDRSFTTMSERMSPEVNFNFLNAFFGRMGLIIRLNEGFIDKYIGDVIMALFPGKAEYALRAATSQRRSAHHACAAGEPSHRRLRRD